MSVEIDVQITSAAAGLPDESELQQWAEMALHGRQEQAELTIRLVDEDESRQLNRDFRGRDKPTNVLSFPAEIPAYVGSHLLGDLVICAPVVRHEAELQGKPLRAHWAHMVVHGTLHLSGLDHQTDREASMMERAEVKILSQLGFSDPYLDDSEL